MTIDPRAELLAAANAEASDIAAAALWIDCEDCPETDRDACLERIQQLAAGLRERLDAGTAPAAALRSLLRDELKLRGAGGGDPRAHYLHHVMERGAAVPLTASILWIAVGQAAGLKICGVGLPGHFIVRLQDELIDALNGDDPLDESSLKRMVEETTGKTVSAIDPEWLAPKPVRSILARVSRNLRGCYTSLQEWDAALRAADRCVALLPESPVDRRDRGFLLWRMGRTQDALRDLHAYLEMQPDASDVNDVREVMGRLRSFMN